MFSGLGGNETWQKPKKSYAEDDEFHLGTATDADSMAAKMESQDSLTRILDRYPIDISHLDHLEGDDRVQATQELYRRGALRDARTSSWIREQCAPLLLEQKTCLENVTVWVPFFTCASEEHAYSHCLSIAKRAASDRKKNYSAGNNLVWAQLMDPSEMLPKPEEPL